jgi:hypothetical protein
MTSYHLQLSIAITTESSHRMCLLIAPQKAISTTAVLASDALMRLNQENTQENIQQTIAWHIASA